MTGNDAGAPAGGPGSLAGLAPPPPAGPVRRVAIRAARRPGAAARAPFSLPETVTQDDVVTEEPLEIRLVADAGEAVVAVTMRTPGADGELAAGFLACEGIVAGREDIAGLDDVAGFATGNVLRVRLASAQLPDLGGLARHFFSSAACGVCGKAGLEKLTVRGGATPVGPVIDAEVLASLAGELRARQEVFAATGGLHGAALFDAGGRLLAAREDVGRHNAVDKVLGWALLSGRWPIGEAAMVVSGRAGFEIVQKCVAAGVPVLAAVSAPSSLAIETADAFGLTLVGFLSARRFNVYAGEHRIGYS